MKYSPEDQYRRMMRSYESLRALAKDMGPVGAIDYGASDAAGEFFIHCFQLKDWLGKDARFKKSDVESFVSQSAPLSVAGDICNSLKHAGLDRAPRAGAPLTRINTAVTLMLPRHAPGPDVGKVAFKRNPRDGDTVALKPYDGERMFATSTVTVTLGSQKRDALELATECLAEWERFLAAHGVRIDVAE